MIRNTRLKCGLELVHHYLPHTRFVEIALGVGVGSRYEPKKLSGISHFIEHMLFRGCERLPSSYQLNFEFDRIGDGLNAMTYKEFTLYTTKVPAQHLNRALDLMAQVLGHPLFNEIDTERGIILEEILEELDENGNECDIENISRRKIFGDHPLARPVLGRSQTVKRLKTADLREFHARHYVTSNMVLAISGAVPWNQCKTAADLAFARYPLKGHGGVETPESASKPRPGLYFIEGKGSQTEVLISFSMPGEQDPGELSRLFLSRVLDDGISSRLQRTVCERRGLLYDISCGIESFTDVALFDVQFSVSSSKLLEVVELVMGELTTLKREVVGSEEFMVVRDRFTRDVQETSESTRHMSSLMAEAFLLKLPMPIDSQEYQERIKETTPDNVRTVARQAFMPANCSLTVKGRVSAAQKKKLVRLVKAV